jgi:hypothetical protein
MPTSDNYASIEDAKAYLAGEEQRGTNDVKIADAIAQASRAIDAHCGRIFYQEIDATDTPTARVYYPRGDVVWVDDFWTLDDLVVAVDNTDTGTYGSTVTDFQPEPLNQIANGLRGIPYYRLRTFSSWPTGKRPSVRVTARWGYESVPDPVRQSTLHLAASLFKLEHAPFGVLAVGDFGPIKAPVDTLRNVKALLGPYCRGDQTCPVGAA